MKKSLILEVSAKNKNKLEDFYQEININKVQEKFVIFPIDPILRFREDFINEIVNNGYSSFLSFSLTMDDIITPSMTVDDVEKVFNKFVENLLPIKHLIIVDPYFYPNVGITDTANTFLKLIAPIIDNLLKLTIIYNGTNKKKVEEFHRNIKLVNSNIEISNHIVKDFHDRFWINPKNKKGLAIGTSLNGIRKKISLIDNISELDVDDLILELKKYNISIE